MLLGKNNLKKLIEAEINEVLKNTFPEHNVGIGSINMDINLQTNYQSCDEYIHFELKVIGMALPKQK